MLSETEHVSGSGAYQTSLVIPAPPGPGAPQLALAYDSQVNASLAGMGWDLSVGYPMLIVRDVRFGTQAWKYGADWMWGSTPLVRLNSKTCADKCDYRTAPESLVSVRIDLSLPPFPDDQPVQPLHERATVQMPNGTTLDYEPIYYDGVSYPAAPAGAETNVFGFRLFSVTDRNGYATCFRYRAPQTPQQIDAQQKRGRVAPLSQIAYGVPPSATVASCTDVFTHSLRHVISFDYQTPADLGYYSTWTLRFGAASSFEDLLSRVSVYPRRAQSAQQAQQAQDEFALIYYAPNENDTRRPLLREVVQKVPVRDGTTSGTTASRTVRAFAYGKRSTQFANAEIIELGDDPSIYFPSTLGGAITRPVRRASVFQNPNGIFQAGQDQDSDAAPPTHATTEQWGFLDVNGDRLLDLQWGRERGWDRQWPTFEAGALDPAVSIAQRPAQQRVIINHGLVTKSSPTQHVELGSSFTNMQSSAPALESDFRPRSTPRVEDGGPFPTRRQTSWIWGEGRGLTRTGMPVTISGGETPTVPGSCPRRWPVYPDGTLAIPDTSVFLKLKEKAAINSNSMLAGTAIIGDIVQGIYDGYRPTFGVSATVSGWADMDGDGLPEFVATPGWIDRFRFNLACPKFGLDPASGVPGFPYTQDASYADAPQTATDSNGNPEHRWFYAGTLDDSTDPSQVCEAPPGSTTCLKDRAGPAGPIGLPINFETSTGNTEGFGFTLPIGAIYATLLSAAVSGNWYSAALSAPGITIATHAPRAAGGVRLSMPGPSAGQIVQAARSVAGTLQNFGSAATTNDISGVFGFLMSLAKVDFDFTLLSGTTQNRSESRAQLMDINADGLPDYVLYSSGTNVDANCGAGTTSQGKLVAYLNSPEGFGLPGNGPLIINCGFDYPSNLQALDAATLTEIEGLVEQASALVNELVSPFDIPGPEDGICQGDAGTAFCTAYAVLNPVPPDQLCKSQAMLLVSCVPYMVKIENLAARAERVVALAGPFMALSVDEISRERELVTEVGSLKDFLRGFGLSIQLHPDVASVDATTAVARTIADNLAYIARSVRHINHTSRINVVSQGFSRLGGQQPTSGADNWQPFWQPAFGSTVQTRGFVDLNGDGLPDYVLTADRDAPTDPGFCPVGTWKVFWGTGTSAASAGRAFLPTPECVPVPAAPTAVTNYGYSTLPLNFDLLKRDGTDGTKITSTIYSFVTLADMNGDGRPDIVIAADTLYANSTSETWQVFLNNGRGFDLDPSRRLDIASPTVSNTNLEVATCLNPTARGCRDVSVNVPFPSIRTTETSDRTRLDLSRNRTDTHAAMLDLDGDGNAEMVRRIRIRDNGDLREGLLIWRRPEMKGPQDLLAEERDPVSGTRVLVEYKPANEFQWRDARPDGKTPEFGHHNLAGVPGRLVRSVTTERLIGSAEQRTRRGYDYKLPHYDVKTRMSDGFALRSSFALDPLPDDPKLAQPLEESVVQIRRNSQRPNATGGTTHARAVVRRSGAPVFETLTSYAESDPTTRCPGIGSAKADTTSACPAVGGIEAVFSAPKRTLTVEYPGSLQRGPIFDLGFDGREPWTDRVTRRTPVASPSSCPPFNDFLSRAPVAGAAEATGGAASFASALPVQCPAADTASDPVAFTLQYDSLYPRIGNAPASVSAAAIETWIKPTAPLGSDEVIVEQAGAYQLVIATAAGAPHWQLKVGSAVAVTSAGPDDLGVDRWQHVVATFGPSGARMFVNGRLVGSTNTAIAAAQPNGRLLVGCGVDSNGAFERCFNGTVGELRVYPEYWQGAPRVTDSETELSLPATCTFDDASCPHDFGQPLIVRNRNDLAMVDDDVATEYEYAVPDRTALGNYPLYGLVSTEGAWAPKADGTPGQYLSFGAHWYDDRPFGQASIGNESRRARFDGMPQAQRPSVSSLRVSTKAAYASSCPGRVTEAIDPLGFVTKTSWDETCTFQVSVTNQLGHRSRTRIYGVEDDLPPLEQKRGGAYGTFQVGGRYGQVASVIDANGAMSLATYDEWGRLSARWSPLDRTDRPGLRTEYRDALCERMDPAGFVEVGCNRVDVPGVRLKSPPRVMTFMWDDQLPRCLTGAGRVVECADSGAERFASEQAPGGYRRTYAFGDGQLHMQGVDKTKPAWTVSGIQDFDRLGRMTRAYRIKYLPSACPSAVEWCGGSRLSPDPLRSDVAAVQIAFDERSRVVRYYGAGWPRCEGEPSEHVSTTSGFQPKCDTPRQAAKVNDVTRFQYPGPGETLTIDANGIPVLTRQDVRGLVTLYQEYLGSSAAPIAYSGVASTYDALGRLVSTTDEHRNATINAYDALSRLRSSADPDLGLTTYEYDLHSQLVDRTVASGEKTHNEYDALGRIIQTDYLRPRSVPAGGDGSGPTLRPGDTVGDEPDKPDRFCVSLEFLEPTRFIPAPPGPPREALRALPLTSGDRSSGQTQVSLPFDFAMTTVAVRRGEGSDRPLAAQQAAFAFEAGTPIVISTDGRMTLGQVAPKAQMAATPAATAAPGARGVLNVFPVDLALKEGGLRSGVVGEKGQQTLIVEWEGVIAGRPEGGRVLVRAILTERPSNVRYEYVSVPPDVDAAPGLQFVDGPSGYSRSLAPGGELSPIYSGTAFDFGGVLPDQKGLRFTCGPREKVKIPFAAGTDMNPKLSLGVRAFSACGAPGLPACKGNMEVGWRVAAPSGEIHPLTTWSYTARDMGHANDIDGEIANAIDMVLPSDVQGKDFDVIVGTSGEEHPRLIVDVIWGGQTRTVYDPEERVHRVYDSSEPPYYIAAELNNRLTEVKPVLDVTFDVPGVIADRSPTRVAFDACAPAWRDPSAFVTGASGKGLSLPSHSECTGTVDPGRALSEFTAELWVRSQCEALAGACVPRSILRAGQFLSIELNADGRVECRAGSGVIDSDEPLPANVWVHVAVSFDAKGSVRCLINGVAQGLQPVAAPANRPMVLGDVQLGENVNAFSVIDIDEVRIVDRARPDEEILADALRPLNVGPPRGNLVHIDFAHPYAPPTCANALPCGQIDQSKARNSAWTDGGRIVPGILGMAFDTRQSRSATGGGQPSGPPTGRVEIPHSNTLRLADAVTAEVWVKRTGIQTETVNLISKWAGAAAPGWRLQVLPSGRLRWEVVTRQTVQGSTSSTLRRAVLVTWEALGNEWRHVAAIYDGQRLRVFGDGLPWHRWCGSGPREGAQGDPPGADNCLTPPADRPICTIETVAVPDQLPGPGGKPTRIGDAECIEGTIDNTERVLVAADGEASPFDGFIDEIRVSNIAKREFEIAASARLASAYTQVIGRETILRNRFIWRDGRQVGPLSNDAPYDVAQQPARESRAFDVQGGLASTVKHVVGQKSPAGYFVERVAGDSFGRNGLLEYAHGEVLASRFGLDGTLRSLTGYGPFLALAPSQSQPYVKDGAATITGQAASVQYGNDVRSEWTYDDGPVPGGMFSSPSGAFGPDSLRTAKVTTWHGALSDRTYEWDPVGNLTSVRDGAFNRAYRADYTYDDLRRVVSATQWGPGSLTLGLAYCYDPLGNLLLIDGVGNPKPNCYDAQGRPVLASSAAPNVLRAGEGGVQLYGRSLFPPACPTGSNALPHALTQRTVLLTGAPAPSARTGAHCYDAAGRLIWSIDPAGDRTFKYFARGKPSAITSGGLTSEYLYDGDGVRVSKTEGPGERQTVLSPRYRELAEVFSATGALPRFEALYASIARRVLSRAAASDPLITASDDLVWLSADHLGGTYFLTNLLGTEVAGSRAYYRPFGGYVQAAPAAEGQSGHRQFTSKERDGTGLYDFSARLYDPASGRFAQGDDVEPGRNAQALNRYSYVRNSPLRMIDPTGHAGEELSSQVDWMRDPEGGTVAVRRPIPGEVTLRAERFAGALIASDPQLSETYDYLSRFIRDPRIEGVNYCEAPGWCFSNFDQVGRTIDPNNGSAVSTGWLIDVAVTAGMVAPVRGGVVGLADRYIVRGAGEYVLDPQGAMFATTSRAGGKLWTSVGTIDQTFIEPIVGASYGTRVHILTGVHGSAAGGLTVDARLFFADFRRFGQLPNVSIHNVAVMSPAQISAILNGRGTIIGAFCHSANCLQPFLRMP